MSWGMEFPRAERERSHKPECEMAEECLPEGLHWPDADGLACNECGAVCACDRKYWEVIDAIDALKEKP